MPNTIPVVNTSGLTSATSKPVTTIPVVNTTGLTSNEYPLRMQDMRGFDYNTDADKYKRYITNIYPGIDLERQAAGIQSTASKLGHAAVRGIVSEIGIQGVIGGAGALLGLPKAITDEIRGKDAEFNNFITHWANNLTEAVEEKTPMFRYNPNRSFDWSDPAWWGENSVSVFSTLGLFIPVLGVTKAASYISKGLKIASELEKAGKMGKVAGALSGAFDMENATARTLHSAFAMRNVENFRESNSVFINTRDQIYNRFKDDDEYNKVLNSEVGQEFLAEGRSANKIELANFIASKAAWHDYGINSANIVFDIAQLVPAFRTFEKVTSRFRPAKVLEAEAKAAGTTVSKSALRSANIAKGLGLVVGEQVSEGVEELVNAVAEKDAYYYAKHLTGLTDKKDASQRLNEYLHDPTNWEQAFWGFFGGVAFSGLARGYREGNNIVTGNKDPYGIKARIQEIEGRSATIGIYGGILKKIDGGVDPRSNKAFEGTEDEIQIQKENAIDTFTSELGYDLGKEAAVHGNLDGLLDMINHPNFKQMLIDNGIANADTIDSTLINVQQDIADAAHVYETVNNRLSRTVSNGNIVGIMSANAVQQKSVITRFSKQRDKHRAKATELRANNPIFESLRDKYKDKDLDATINSIIDTTTADIIRNQISEVKASDKVTGEAFARRYETKIKELKESSKNENFAQLEDSEIEQIADYVSEEALARTFDVAIGAQTDKFADVTDPKIQVPKITKDIEKAVAATKDMEYGLFKLGVLRDSIVASSDTEDAIQAKIKSLSDIQEELNDNKNRYSIQGLPISKKDINRYKSLITNQLSVLKGAVEKRQKAKHITEVREKSNTNLINNFNSRANTINLKLGAVTYTGKYDLAVRAKFEALNSVEVVPGTGGRLDNFADYIRGVDVKKVYGLTEDQYDDYLQNVSIIAKALNDAYLKHQAVNREEGLVNELLLAIGYVDENISISVTSENPHTAIANEFRTAKDLAEEGDDIKSAIDFTVGGDIQARVALIAAKWITDIINSGADIASEFTKNGTPRKNIAIHFETIAKQYASLVGEEDFKKGFEDLKEAFGMVAGTQYKRANMVTTYSFPDFKTSKNILTLKQLKVEEILSQVHNLQEVTELQNSHNEIIDKTGGPDALNIYLGAALDISGTRDENGNLVISDEAGIRLQIALNQLYEGSSVTVQIDKSVEGDKGFIANKDDAKNVPISVNVSSDINGKEVSVKLGHVNTSFTMHNGTPYRFKGKDWFDQFIGANREIDGHRTADIAELYQFLREWYITAKSNKFGSKEEIEAYQLIIDNDITDIVRNMIDSKYDLFSAEAKESLRHIMNVMMFGENINQTVSNTFNHIRVSQNIKNWRDKLYRDHINIEKIRKEIGTDTTKTIKSHIAYHTSGNIVKSKDKDGNVVLRPVTSIKDSGSSLFIVNRTAGGSQLINTTDSGWTITKPGNTGVYNSAIYVGIHSNGTPSNNSGSYIPVSLMRNTLGGGKYESSNSAYLIDRAFALIKQLGKAREEMTDTDIITSQLDTIVFSTGESNGVMGETKPNRIIYGNGRIRFFNLKKEGGNEIVFYNYRNNSYYTQDSTGNHNITEEEFKNKLGNLERNIHYKSFETGEFVQNGITYTSYSDYLLQTNSILTDVGSVVNSKGEFVSHFIPKVNDSIGGTPLIVNIDTKNIETKAIEKTAFETFSETLSLDSRYKNVFNIISETLKGSNSKFIGVISGKGKTATGEVRFGGFNPSTGEIFLTEHWVKLYNKNKTSATLILAHELIHGLMGNLSKIDQQYLNSRLDYFRTTILNSPEYKALDAKENKTNIEEKLIKIINTKDLEELITYGLTDTDFAGFLTNISAEKREGQTTIPTLWDELKIIIRNFLNTIGLQYSKQDELTDIVNSVFDKKSPVEDITSKTEGIKLAPTTEDIKRGIEDEIADSDEIIDFGDTFSAIYTSTVSNLDINSIDKLTTSLSITFETTETKSVEDVITDKISKGEIKKVCAK